MTVYESLISEDKQRPCKPSNPCCQEPCDEPSFWDLLPQCRLNWIALGLATVAIGFGIIGLGYINVGVIVSFFMNLPFPPPFTFDAASLTQGSRLIAIFLAIILVSAWILFKACSDDWNIVVVGSLVGASGFPVAALGLLYFTVAQFATGFDPTWLNIARNIIIASILGFLFLAYRVYTTSCQRNIDAKKAVVVSLIFLSAGWASWSLGRLLWTAVATFQFSKTHTLPDFAYTFPSSAFGAFIFVSIINIVLVVALGWYVLNCVADNCFTAFLPFFASTASLGNWALYRVGLNVLSYTGEVPRHLTKTLAQVPTQLGFPAGTPLIPFAIAIGLISIAALALTFTIANCPTNFAVIAAASAAPLLYAIAKNAFVATADNLLTKDDFVNSILHGIFLGIALTAVLVFLLRCRAKCPIPNIIYGLASGTFGWAVIYLYSTYSADILSRSGPYTTTVATLTIGLVVVISVAIVAVLYVQHFVCDELLSAITLLLFALLTVGAGGLIGTIAYYQAGALSPDRPPPNPLNLPDKRAAIAIYVIFVLIALFAPRHFAKCSDIKRQLVIAIASLAFGIAAVDFGRAVVFARAVAFVITGSGGAPVDFSTLPYILSVFGTVLVGPAIVWTYSQANLYTALIACLIGFVAGRIATQVTILVDAFFNLGTGLVATPWLIFTLGLVALLVFLELKSLCIPQHCRFLLGLLIPALGVAVFARVAGASAAAGAVFAFPSESTISFSSAFFITSRLILVNLIIPLAGSLLSLQAFKCTSCLAYLASCIVYTGVVYVASQFEFPASSVLSPFYVTTITPPFANIITSAYANFDLNTTDLMLILPYVTYITQTGFVYILFLAPALIFAFALSCSKPISSAILGAAIAAALVSVGAIGVSNVISGVLAGFAFANSMLVTPEAITHFTSFSAFLSGIKTQLVLLVVGVLTILFIISDKCCYRPC